MRCNTLQGVKLCAANMQLSKQTRPACPSPKHLTNDLTMVIMMTMVTTLMMRMRTMMKMSMMTQFILDARGGGSNN